MREHVFRLNCGLFLRSNKSRPCTQVLLCPGHACVKLLWSPQVN